MEGFQDIEHFVKSLYAAIKKKIPTKVSQLTNDAGYKTTDTNTTYKLSKSGSTVTLTGSDGSTTSVTDSNTTYSSLKNPYSLTIQNNGTTVASYDGSTAETVNVTNATSSSNGLMSAEDKSKLDGIASSITDLQSKLAKITDKIYPVGSIYISVNSISPADLFGGTWEQIKDRFLLAAGDAYAAGSTGGEAQHTLTVDEMPSHHHAIELFASDRGLIGTKLRDAQQGKPLSAKWDEKLETASAENREQHILCTGGNAPHNNMPPYLAVCVWKRTA